MHAEQAGGLVGSAFAAAEKSVSISGRITFSLVKFACQSADSGPVLLRDEHYFWQLGTGNTRERSSVAPSKVKHTFNISPIDAAVPKRNRKKCSRDIA
jgi:hypothetical protein